METSSPNPEPVPADEVIRTIDWRPEETADFILWQFRGTPHHRQLHSRAQRRARTEIVFLLGAVAISIATAVFGIAARVDALAAIGVLAGFLSLMGLALSATTSVGMSQARYERLAASEAKTITRPRVEVRITPAGVHTIMPEGSTFAPWSDYAEVEETRLLVISRGYDGKVGAVPKRCLGTGTEFARTQGIIMGWFRAAGGGSPEPVIDMLKNHGIRCRSCGYNLRGIQKLVCPECGRELGLVDL